MARLLFIAMAVLCLVGIGLIQYQLIEPVDYATARKSAALTLFKPAANKPTATQMSSQSQGRPLTEVEVLKRLEQEGFRSVTRLAQDGAGNWVANGRRKDRSVEVVVDREGRLSIW